MRIFRIQNLIDRLNEERSCGRRIGLVCGCFDILHLGHIELFRFGRKHVDILVVGVDTDESIRRSKGANRPIHDVGVRLEQVAELRSVDYVFPIACDMVFGDPMSFESWRALLRALRPDVLITNQAADRFCEAKQLLADRLGMEFVVQKEKKAFSSTRVERLHLESP